MNESIFNSSSLYDRFLVRLYFRFRIYGGLPKSKEILDKWIAAKGEHPRDTLQEKERVLDLTEETEQVWCGFRESDGPYIREFQIESLLAQCGTTSGLTMTKRGSKGIIQHGLHVTPREIHFSNSNGHIKKIHGSEDFTGTVQTAQGKRSIIKRVDYIEKATIEFTLLLLKSQSKITEKILKELLHLGEENGLGSCRSLGGGRFNVVEFTKL